MRPGPGLVVMALAFISGARRGSSTSQQQQDEQQQQHYHQQQQQQQQQQKHQKHQNDEHHLTILPNIYLNFNTNTNSNINNNNNNNNNYNFNYVYNNNYVSNNKLGKIGYDNDEENGGTGGNSALARVNPWLSACDLAQPNQAPDLQGQCSAGTLPVAWVDEGPGPPHCPQSCEQLRLEKNNKIINNNYVNDNKYINKVISKSNNNKNNNNNNNNNNNFNTMEYITNVRHQMQHQKQQETPHQKITEQQQIQQQQQQCLDYLGDNEESSPAQLCKNSRNVLANKLRSLRMRHCCERTVFSALHTLALNTTLNGGRECIRTLNDILDMDALATRITCEFTEILVRYDCRQPYSLIHHCEDCKEAYRRWVCSTLIPYFAEPEDIRQNTTTSNTINKTENHSATSSNLYHIRKSRSSTTMLGNTRRKEYSEDVQRHKYSGTSDESQSISTAIANPIVKDPVIDRLLKRTKRKSQVKRRRRIRPCLSVCQTVEQKCPYMLPGDRAPAYPTQYAGEPTFLCLDRNIQETGEQFRKSNNGPENCCYRYCGYPSEGICAYCDLPTNHSNNTVNNTTVPSSLDQKITVRSDSHSSNIIPSDQKLKFVNIDNIYYYDDYDDLPNEAAGNCQNFHSTTPISSHPCTIPYYSSSSIKLVSTLFYFRYLVIWTILWCLVNITTINNWTKNLSPTHSVKL